MMVTQYLPAGPMAGRAWPSPACTKGNPYTSIYVNLNGEQVATQACLMYNDFSRFDASLHGCGTREKERALVSEREQSKIAMVIMAHPDDAEFGCAGTVALWVREGWDVYYVVCTDGA